MIALVGGFILLLLCLGALRTEGVSWKWAIPLSLVPMIAGFFLGIMGIIMGAMYAGALWKMDLSAMR